jgi:hypothetical protein
MSEAALAVLYLHERGLRCGELNLGSVFCARHEDRAVLFAVGLVKVTSSSSVDCDSTSTEWRRQALTSDVRAISRLPWMPCTSSNRVRMARPQECEGSLRDRDGIPRERPHFIIEAEWEVLLSLSRVHSKGSALHAIDELRGLAGIPADLDDSIVLEPDLDTVDGEFEINALMVHRVGMTLGEMLRECEQAEGFDLHCSRIHSRLEDVCLQFGGSFLQVAGTTEL